MAPIFKSGMNLCQNILGPFVPLDRICNTLLKEDMKDDLFKMYCENTGQTFPALRRFRGVHNNR